MKKLDYLLLKSYFGPLLLTFVITLFVFDMQFLWKYIDDLIGKGLETSILFELLYYASATMVPLALPLAVLLASIMTFGSFGEHFELTAIKSSGISLFRFMRPLILFSLFLALAAFYFSNNILPVSNLKFRTLLYDIRHQKPALDFQPGFFNNDISGFSIRIESKSVDEKTIYGVLIYDHTKGVDNKHVIIADSAKFLDTHSDAELVIVLYNGFDYKDEAALSANPKNDDTHYKTKFDKWEKHFDLSDFQLKNTDEGLFSKMHGMLNIRQIVRELDTVSLRKEKEIKLLKKNISNHFVNLREEHDTTNTWKLDSLSKTLIHEEDNKKVFYLQRNHIDSNRTIHYDTLQISSFEEDFHQKNKEEQKAILANASNTARNIRNVLMSKKEILKAKDKDKGKYWIEIHRKFTLAIACIVLFFIGAPLGSIVKKGGLGWPMVMAVLFFVLYHLFTIVGEKSALKNVIDIWQGMWLSTMILLPIGIFLTIKAKNDSKLFNGDKLSQFIQNRYNKDKKIITQKKAIYNEYHFYSLWSFKIGIAVIFMYLSYFIYSSNSIDSNLKSILDLIVMVFLGGLSLLYYLFGMVALFKIIKLEKLTKSTKNTLVGIAIVSSLFGINVLVYPYLAKVVKEKLLKSEKKLELKSS